MRYPGWPSVCMIGAIAVGPLAVVGGAAAQPAAADPRTVVETLSSDEMGGRLTGTDGSHQAAQYIISQLSALGAAPLPGTDGFRQPFEFTAGVEDGGTTLSMTGPDGDETRWTNDAVRALSFSDVGHVSGEVVFAGYGLVVPETGEFSYDSYATLDVEGKIVVALRYFPEDTEGDVRGALARYSGPRYKAMAARQRGAVGLILVAGPNSPNAGQLMAMTFDNAISGSSIYAASVTDEVGATLLGVAGRTLGEVQAALDGGNPHVSGFAIPGVTLALETHVERERRTGYNVVGMLPATSDAPVEKPYVVLGGHYDHLGRGTGGNSLAREAEAGQIHNGADDNASGVAAILAAGAGLAQTNRARGIVLAFWSGEELGLLGSEHFIESSTIPADQIAAYVNFDMVGRLSENSLSVQAVGTSPIWTGLVEDLNGTRGFDLQFVADPYLPTDVISFNAVGVPSLGLFTGSHEDYHRPTDDAERINYEGLERIAALGRDIAAHLATDADPPMFVRVERVAQQGSQSAIRIFTGTIPDYTEDANGLLLSGVVAGGPAERAGLRAGDVVIELAGHTIANIYDYTYALDLLRVGQPATIVFRRNDRRIEAAIVPEARE